MRMAWALPAVFLIAMAGQALATQPTAPAQPLSPGVAPAPPPPAAVPLGPLPHGLAGYAQPPIPPSACRTVSPAEVECVIPAMTAGRYLIEAAGTSSAPLADAQQALEIDVGGRQCGIGKDTAAWTSGPRTFKLACDATLMADSAVPVRVLYADAKATKDPKGPVVTIRPLPWNGVLSVQPFVPKQ